MSDEPTIDELIEIAKFHKKRLESHCGYDSQSPCFRCRTSKKIVTAWNNYEEARVNGWPEEIPACEKCGSFSNVGRWGRSEEGLLNICETCCNDKDGLVEWIAEGIKEALDGDPNYELQPDGRTYKFIGMTEPK